MQREGSIWEEGDRREGNQGEGNWREGYRGERSAEKPLDKEEIRQIVLQILAERLDDKERVAQQSISQPVTLESIKLRTDIPDTNADTAPDIEPGADAGMIDELDQGDLEVIFGSLEALRG